jgi:hypothetical protein
MARRPDPAEFDRPLSPREAGRAPAPPGDAQPGASSRSIPAGARGVQDGRRRVATGERRAGDGDGVEGVVGVEETGAGGAPLK